MKTLLPVCLVALSLDAGSAWAAGRLSDPQMDQISAGVLGLDIPSCAGVSACGSVLTTSTSSVVTKTNAAGVVTTTTITGGVVTANTTLSGNGTAGGTGGTGGSMGTTPVETLPTSSQAIGGLLHSQ